MNTDFFEHRGPLAVITLNNPPVNSLSHALRQRIVAAQVEACRKPVVAAINGVALGVWLAWIRP